MRFALPLRLARRELRRRPGRTALVALLVAVPVAGMVLATVSLRTGQYTPAKAWERANGQADAVGDIGVGLPAGSRAIVVSYAFFRARTTDGASSDLRLSDLPLRDPMAAGIYDLAAGRAPTGTGEVALSRGAAQGLEVALGDDLVLERPSVTFAVVGLIERRDCLSCPYAVVAPGEVPVELPGQEGYRAEVLADLPDGLTPAERETLLDQALAVYEAPSEAEGVSPDDDQSVEWSLVIGALVLTVVGIVISAAFAVGARRQLVTIGQLSASGTPPRTVRAALVLQGTITGLLGGLVGLAIGAAALVGGRGRFERLLDERIPHYDVSMRDVALALLLGMMASTVAALIPARTAARIPTLAALAGRRPVAPVSRRLVAGGVVAVAGGLALLGLAVFGSRGGADGSVWVLVAIVGGVSELLGACAIAPAVVAHLEPLARRLRGALRLGARSLARNRARTGAVVSAVAASGALAIGSAALVLGDTAKSEYPTFPDDVVAIWQEFVDEVARIPEVGPPPSATLADVRQVLTGAEEATVRATVDPTGGFWEVAPDPDEPPSVNLAGSGVLGGKDRALIADEALLDAIHAGDEVRDALNTTGIVLLSSASGAALVTPPAGSAAVPATVVSVPHHLGYQTDLLISEERASELDLVVAPMAQLFRASKELTDAQRVDLEDIRGDLEAAGGNLSAAGPVVDLRWSWGGGGATPLQLELILSGIALAFSLFVVGVSLALAAAESKDERDILTIAGAPPGALARSAGARAWLLASIGGAMAIPVGFLPVVVFSYASRDQPNLFAGEPFPLVFPIRTGLLLLLAVPAVVAVVALLSSAAALRLRPVRVSTATFE